MRWWVFWATLLVLTCPVSAEVIDFTYTEPLASATPGKTLAYTTSYWCRGATCTNWTPAVKVLSDNGAGGDTKTVPISVELTAGTLPLTVRLRVTATDTTGNTTAGAITTHTFSP